MLKVGQLSTFLTTFMTRALISSKRLAIGNHSVFNAAKILTNKLKLRRYCCNPFPLALPLPFDIVKAFTFKRFLGMYRL